MEPQAPQLQLVQGGHQQAAAWRELGFWRGLKTDSCLLVAATAALLFAMLERVICYCWRSTKAIMGAKRVGCIKPVFLLCS
jgi:hypothetical protein